MPDWPSKSRSPRSNSILIALVGRQVLPAADTERTTSVLRFAAIQGIKRKQDLADLAPKGRFISAEAIERVIGQVGEMQEAPRELSGGMDDRFDRFWRGARHGFRFVRDAVPCRIVVEIRLSRSARTARRPRLGRPGELRAPGLYSDGGPEFRTGQSPLSWRGAAATADWPIAVPVPARPRIEHHNPQ